MSITITTNILKMQSYTGKIPSPVNKKRKSENELVSLEHKKQCHEEINNKTDYEIYIKMNNIIKPFCFDNYFEMDKNTCCMISDS